MRYKIGDYVEYDMEGFHKGKIINESLGAVTYYQIDYNKINCTDWSLKIIRKLTFREIIVFYIEKLKIKFIRWFY